MLALALATAACGPDPAFHCQAHESCAPDGRCEDNGFCSFPDTRCPSGRRFAAHAGDVSGECVPAAAGSTDATTGGGTTEAASSGGATGSTSAPSTTLPVATTSTSSDGSAGSEADSDSGAPDPLAEGLVVHLPLDDDFAGGVAIDVSGNELHAQCDACPTSVQGRVGSAAGFSSDAVLVIADDPLLRPQDAFSVSVWVLDADPQSMQTQFIVGKVLSGIYDTFQLSTSIGPMGNADDELVWRITDAAAIGSNHELYVPNPLDPDVWHHLVGVWSGATATLYLDGAAIGEVDAPAAAYDAGAFVVGADDNDGYLYFWRGAIDEVRFYDRALSEAEIVQLAAER